MEDKQSCYISFHDVTICILIAVYVLIAMVAILISLPTTLAKLLSGKEERQRWFAQVGNKKA